MVQRHRLAVYLGLANQLVTPGALYCPTLGAYSKLTANTTLASRPVVTETAFATGIREFVQGSN